MALPKYHKGMASPRAEPKKRGRPAAPSPPPAAKSATKAAALRAPSLEPPSKKRGKVSGAASEIAAANAAAAKRAMIAEAVREAQGVPSAVREMLCSTMFGCCCASGEFHPFQDKILRMLDQTLKDIQADKTRRFQAAARILCRAKADMQSVDKERENAEAAASASSADTTQKEIALAQSAVALQPCKSAVEAAQTALQRVDAVIGAAAMEIEQLRSARAQMGNVSEETALASLQRLHSALASEKFDNLAVLEGELCQRLAALSEIVSKEALARVTLVDDLEDAQTLLDAANNEHQLCIAALERSQSEQHERVAILKTKTQTWKQQKTAVAQAVRAWNIAQRSLEEFQKGPRAAFKDIVHEIEQRHGIHLFEVEVVMETGTPPSASDLVTAAQLNQNRDKDLLQSFTFGTPVIDRRDRQAVLRRRSAALPMNCFSRLSLMARRSSMVAKRRISETADMETGTTPSTSEFETTGQLNQNKDKYLLQNCPAGTPVIDRGDRQAVLRRRSAALPMNCFSRLSLMARRSSVAAKLRISETSNDSAQTTSLKACSSDSDADSTLETQQTKTAEIGQESQVLDAALRIPTPNRISF